MTTIQTTTIQHNNLHQTNPSSHSNPSPFIHNNNNNSNSNNSNNTNNSSINNNNTDDDINNKNSNSLSTNNKTSSDNNSSSYEDQDNNNTNNDQKSDLSFAKKDLSKSRTQSFQSVLSSASLKSLKHQTITAYNNTIKKNNQQQLPQSMTSIKPLSRANSTLNTNNNHNNSNNTKNFQSFIQAPVLSSIANQKQSDDDENQIGKQSSFDDKSTRTSLKSKKSIDSNINKSDDNNENDEENLLQQQKLTLNALKKLSLSPRPITNSEDLDLSKYETDKPKQEPYQPAEVDLSSFASLTRQPKVNPTKVPSPIAQDDSSNQSPKVLNKRLSMPRLPEGETANITFQNDINQYHNDLKYQQMTSFQKQLQPERFNTSPDHHQPITPNSQTFQNGNHTHHKAPPAAVIPPNDFSSKRKPSNPNMVIQQQVQPSHQPQNPLPTPPPITTNHPTPKNATPKSIQQIKGLRNPMYIPAVLRKTQQCGIMSPNRSSSNSAEVYLSSSPRQNDSYHSHLNEFSQRQLQNSSTASIKSTDSNLSVESNNSTLASFTRKYKWRNNYDYLLNAPPTKKHWVKDETVFKCSIVTCPKEFNFFERRHHCRKCGGIFCKEHTSHTLYINHLAQFTTGGRGTLSKVCSNCIKEYNEFMTQEFGVNMKVNKPTTLPDQVQQDVKQPFSPSIVKSTFTPVENKLKTSANKLNDKPELNNRSEQLVGSVPANWNWSSF